MENKYINDTQEGSTTNPYMRMERLKSEYIIITNPTNK